MRRKGKKEKLDESLHGVHLGGHGGGSSVIHHYGHDDPEDDRPFKLRSKKSQMEVINQSIYSIG